MKPSVVVYFLRAGVCLCVNFTFISSENLVVTIYSGYYISRQVLY